LYLIESTSTSRNARQRHEKEKGSFVARSAAIHAIVVDEDQRPTQPTNHLLISLFFYFSILFLRLGVLAIVERKKEKFVEKVQRIYL